jgi:tetratricopeptide (TPR) repeat protein
MNLGRNSEAIAAFEKALEIDPKWAIPLFGPGTGLGRNCPKFHWGPHKEAIAAFEKALEIDPKFHYAWNGLGNALNDLGIWAATVRRSQPSIKP